MCILTFPLLLPETRATFFHDQEILMSLDNRTFKDRCIV